MLPRFPEVAIDEQMIPFTGVCRMKQFVRGKPNPEGLKNFVCAAPDGLVLDFEIYQGKNTFLHEESKNLGICPSAVIRSAETLKEGSYISIDRYFTTIPLPEHIFEKKITVTGTIMKSRIPRSVQLTSKKTMARLGRGSSVMSVRADGKIPVVHWFELKNVLLASTGLHVEPRDKCERWSKKELENIVIPRPNIINEYNSRMGGIDSIDRMISYYRISTTRTKKWTVKSILHLIDLGVTNSWILYRGDQKTLGNISADILKLLDFKISYADSLFEKANTQTAGEKRSLLMVTRSNLTLSVSRTYTSATKQTTLHLPIVASDLKNAVRCENPG
ncbi:hypothetical protein JTB14_021669 [Gonioctena quinquepunctata]|nr:hypothetical protein JTB14_021669 [Gonioctena quinquepunctata]